MCEPADPGDRLANRDWRHGSRRRAAVPARGVLLAAAGLIAGLIAAVAASRALTSMLFDVGAADPVTFVAVTGVLAVAALAASHLPARRAARVDPMEALAPNNHRLASASASRTRRIR